MAMSGGGGGSKGRPADLPPPPPPPTPPPPPPTVNNAIQNVDTAAKAGIKAGAAMGGTNPTGPGGLSGTSPITAQALKAYRSDDKDVLGN